MGVPDLRLAICRRCRAPERRAAGASTDDRLLQAARDAAGDAGIELHCRVSQCLNCCDAGHTVRVEWRGNEVALVGIRTEDEMRAVVRDAADLGAREVPVRWRPRVHQEWVDGRLVYHRPDPDRA